MQEKEVAPGVVIRVPDYFADKPEEVEKLRTHYTNLQNQKNEEARTQQRELGPPSTPNEWVPTGQDYLRHGAAGFQEGGGSLFGLPVDMLTNYAINPALKLAGASPIQEPFMGSATITRGANRAVDLVSRLFGGEGYQPPPPSENFGLRMMRRGGQEAGASLASEVGMIAKGGQLINQGAQQLPRVLEPAASWLGRQWQNTKQGFGNLAIQSAKEPLKSSAVATASGFGGGLVGGVAENAAGPGTIRGDVASILAGTLGGAAVGGTASAINKLPVTAAVKSIGAPFRSQSYFDKRAMTQVGNTLEAAALYPGALSDAPANAALMREAVPGSQPTTGQALNDPGIKSLQAQRSQGLGGEGYHQQQAASETALRDTFDRTLPEGAVGAEQNAWRLGRSEEAGQLQQGLSTAEQARDAALVGNQTGRSQQEVGESLRGTVQQSLADRRIEENRLWNNIPGASGTVVDTQMIRQEAQRIVAEATANGTLDQVPARVRSIAETVQPNYVPRLDAQGNPVLDAQGRPLHDTQAPTRQEWVPDPGGSGSYVQIDRPVTPPMGDQIGLEEALKLRSELGDQIRSLRADPAHDAKQLRDLVQVQAQIDGVLDNHLAGLKPPPGADPQVLADAIENARSFSRSLNQDFRQGNVGRIGASGPTGAPAVAGSDIPNTLTKPDTATAGPENRQQFQRAAGQHPQTETDVRDALLNDALQAARDRNGNIDPNKLRGWITQRGELFGTGPGGTPDSQLLRDFPGLRTRLSNLADLETEVRLLQRRNELVAQGGAASPRDAALAKALDYDFTRDLMKDVMNGKRPMSEAQTILDAARRDPDAMGNIRRAAVEAGAGPDGFKPGSHLNQWLIKNPQVAETIFEPAHLENIRAIAAASENLQAVPAKASKVPGVPDDTGAMAGLLSRFWAVKRGVVSEGWVISERLASMLNKMGALKGIDAYEDLMGQALRNPEKAAEVVAAMREAKNSVEMNRLNRGAQRKRNMFEAAVATKSGEDMRERERVRQRELQDQQRQPEFP